jgi:hypothetical protein
MESILNQENQTFTNKWNIWFHSKKDVWTVDGYEKLYEISNVENYWKLYNNWNKIGGLSSKHYFIMKENVTPIWEDENNKNGGCWSFKISEYQSEELWNDLSNYLVTDNLISTNDAVGLSICLKKNNFSVIKIWNMDSKNNSLNLINKNIIKKWGLHVIYIAHMPE